MGRVILGWINRGDQMTDPAAKDSKTAPTAASNAAAGTAGQAPKKAASGLLDRGLERTRLKVDFDPADFGMAPLSLEILVAGEPSPADLYMPLYNREKRAVEMNPACAMGDEFKASWRDRLLDAEQTKVYVPLAQAPMLNSYFSTFANAIMSDTRAGTRKKTMVLQELADLNMRSLFGSELTPKAVEGAVGQAQEAVTRMSRDTQILSSLGTILKTDYNVYAHSVNVCMLSMAFGRYLRFSESAVSAMGVGGMLHDVGYSKLPKDLLTKEEPLTSAEQEQARNHTRLGYQTLMPIPSVPYDALMIVMHHHENADGSGYPHGLKAEKTPLPARLARLVDAFDAMTSARPHQDARTAYQAAATMMQERDNIFGADLVPTFVRFLASPFITS